MQKGATSAAMDAVQNEDLADVVGEEALAAHKAEEAQFKLRPTSGRAMSASARSST